jgi:hypothetical protein
MLNRGSALANLLCARVREHREECDKATEGCNREHEDGDDRDSEPHWNNQSGKELNR